MSAASIAKTLQGPAGWALVIGVGAVALYVVNKLVRDNLSAAKDEIGEAISGATEGVGGLITGRNTVTADTPYEGAGIFGTLGAGADAASGGAFSGIGEWLGGKIYDFTHNDEDSAGFQSSTGNPYSPTGPTASYRQAANNSPVNAQYAASPLTWGY